MKSRELLTALAIALSTTLLLQYFFTYKQATQAPEAIHSGQRFSAPKAEQAEVHKPLNTEVDFIDARPAVKSEMTVIDTPLARYEFSSEGAILARVEFKQLPAGKSRILSTIHPPTINERERGAFLVALDAETPYYYRLIDQKEEGGKHIISYQAEIPRGTLYKTFTIDSDTYQVGLNLQFVFHDMKSQTGVTPRIFFPSPFVPELEGNDVISGITNDLQGKIQVLPKNDETLGSYWANPNLFGTQDRYFVHAMIKDPMRFAQRGYYQTVDLEHLYSIIEGPQLTKNTDYSVNFYVGPKEDEAFAKADGRLEQTLNYGWFAFVSKPVSKLLLETLNFFYRYVKNYGVAIILLTIMLKLLLLPFTWRSEQSMKKSAEVQKKLEYLNQKYKHDREALNRARTELIQKHGMPGMMGCLPLLLQLPIFWGLSIVLANAIELYQAPFLWIPDLTARDPYFILPILTGIAIFLSTPVADAKKRISAAFTGLVLFAVMANFPSGLVLFMLVSTLLGIAQTFIVKQLKLA